MTSPRTIAETAEPVRLAARRAVRLGQYPGRQLGDIHAALNSLVAHDLPDWTLADTRMRLRQSMRDSFPLHFGDRWEEARDIFYEHSAAITWIRECRAGTELLSRALADSGIYLGVVSNKTGRLLRAESEALGWDRYFGKLVGAGDAPATNLS